MQISNKCFSTIKKVISLISVLLPSRATCMLYRVIGHKIGRNVKIPIFSYIHADKIELGNDVDLRHFVFISVSDLSIGNNAIISFGTQIKGEKSFHAGDNSFIGPHCMIHCDENVTIGFYSGLGPRCTVYTHGSFLPVNKGYPARFEEVVLEDYVWTGMTVTMMPGAYIESNCIINPGLIISSRIKSNTIVQFNASAFSHLSLNRLQKIMKRDNTHHHERILREFLEHYEMQYIHEKTNNSFGINERLEFKYFPDINKIKLVHSGNKEITYDLENYYTDYSTLDIHKKFLFFIRRRFGITLRTIYMD